MEIVVLTNKEVRDFADGDCTVEWPCSKCPVGEYCDPENPNGDSLTEWAKKELANDDNRSEYKFHKTGIQRGKKP